jgi:hypothetical protein
MHFNSFIRNPTLRNTTIIHYQQRDNMTLPTLREPLSILIKYKTTVTPKINILTV